jgi:adenylate cyclase
LDPNLFEAHFFLARNRHALGLRQETADLFERAAALRPNDFRSLGLLSEEYQALGRHDDFLAAARRCLERLEAEISAHPGNAGALAFGSAVLAVLDQQERAEDWAIRAVIIGPNDCMVRYNVARTYVLLGKTEPALDSLDLAFNCSSVGQRRLARWMEQDEDIDPLRTHARFQALLQKLEAELGVES